MVSPSKEPIETNADMQIRECIDASRNFAVIAGAGSGKTTSLITVLKYIRDNHGELLNRDGKRVACITYTNRAVEVISSRLDWDELFLVSTLHTFLWQEVKRYSSDICDALKDTIIPAYIEKKRGEDNGGQSQRAIKARAKIAAYEADIEALSQVNSFSYNDTNFSNYSKGLLGHDDVIKVSAYLISNLCILRKILGQKYPYIMVDEAQDTFDDVVEALNALSEDEGNPIVGYFGDPQQQIYDKRAGSFSPSGDHSIIPKEENFRCSVKVIDLLNAFRTDIQQFPSGENKDIDGSVEIKLVLAEEPTEPRRRYSEEQLERASQKYEQVLQEWGWNERADIKSLFLVRQMIARRQGFPSLQSLFTGKYASSRAKEDYENGVHYLLRPFITTIYPLITAYHENNSREILDILRKTSPAFDPVGVNSKKSLGEMQELSGQYLERLNELWANHTLKEILGYCKDVSLCKLSERLCDDLVRDQRQEYDPEADEIDKGDWLADEFFQMRTKEIGQFVDFINENTPYSTQHGVKGEEYKDVVVVFDDTEAAWNNYSFTKILTPDISGQPTEGQGDRTTKLAYVCFSRAEENLRILLFTLNPNVAKEELIANGLFTEDQITIG